MKHTNYLFYLVLTLFSVLGAGCEKDDDDCLMHHHYLVVRSFDADANDITGTGAVKEVSLYVFDKNGTYLETISAGENQRISLNYEESSPITVVAWGNSGRGRQKMPELVPGKSRLEEAFLTLLSGAGVYALSPDDLFFGRATLDLGGATYRNGMEHRLPIKRHAASMSIRVTGLREFVGTSDTDFYFVVRGTQQRLDFTGNLSGDAAAYKPGVLMNENGQFVSGIFNTFPSAGTGISIEIYKGGTKVYTVSTDEAGRPLVLSPGRLLNVLIELAGGQKVSISVSEWGKVDISQDF